MAAVEQQGVKSLSPVFNVETRDGYGTTDSKMVNCYAEIAGENSKPIAVKRFGVYANATVTASGSGLGMFLLNKLPFVLIGTPGGVTAYRASSDSVVGSAAITNSPQTDNFTFLESPVGEPATLVKNAYVAVKIAYPSGAVTPITDPNYPAVTGGGGAYLNGTYYVLQVGSTVDTNVVRGSALNDPGTWPTLNFIGPSFNAGVSVAIRNYLNYVLAFFSNGIQLFYTSGASTGSTLAPVSNGSWRIGCASKDTVQVIDDAVIFAGVSTGVGIRIYQLSGLSIKPISTPAIERVINNSTFTSLRSMVIRSNGHTFYVLSGIANNQFVGGTVVYDLTTGLWSQWTSVINGQEFPFAMCDAVTYNGITFMQEYSSGMCGVVNTNYYQDDYHLPTGQVVTGPINTKIVTPSLSFDSSKRKFYQAMYLIGNKAGLASVRWSDDDYQSWSAYRSINMDSVRQMTTRLGASRMRAWEINHSDNRPFRLQEIRFEVDEGAA